MSKITYLKEIPLKVMTNFVNIIVLNFMLKKHFSHEIRQSKLLGYCIKHLTFLFQKRCFRLDRTTIATPTMSIIREQCSLNHGNELKFIKKNLNN